MKNLGVHTRIFTQVVRDYMAPPPPLVPGNSPIGDVVRQINDSEATSAIIVDREGIAAGIVTEHDVLRRVAFQSPPNTPVDSVMSSPCRTIPADEYLFQAIAQMRRNQLRHMPVDDGHGRVIGILHLHVAMAIAAARIVDRIDLLAHEGSIDGMTRIKRAQVEVADEMIAEDVPETDIQSLLTHINRDIHRRVVDICLAEMAEGGWGEPPVDFAFIVMGSGGRGENYIYPDQDNGFILEDYPDSEHDRIDSFFIELATRTAKTLDTVGFPLCKGFVMASNPLWRKTLSQWCLQTTLWAKRRGVVALRLSDIFYDFRPVFGNRDLADALRKHVTQLTRNSPVYLSAMYKEGEDHGVALGWFGRFITEKDIEEHRGEINLKHSGTLPLVEAVRLLCLKYGITETSTVKRLDSLHESGFLDSDELDYLQAAFRQIAGLLLRQQVADFKAGRPVNNYVAPSSLSTRERDRLTNAFKAIAKLRDRVRAEFTGDLF